MLTARAIGGQLTSSSETTEARWIASGDLAGYQMDRTRRLGIGHVIELRDRPYVG